MNSNPVDLPSPATSTLKMLRPIGNALMWFGVILLTMWALAALYIDVRILVLRLPMTLLYALGIIVILIRSQRGVGAATLCLAFFSTVLIWWLGLKPSNDGPWQPNADRTGWAEINPS